jgi:polynucleotide 5'-hydroxyl-kinase GRC3/NOL9
MITPSPEWQPVVEDIFKNPGLVMVLGAIDTGKSSFAKYLIQQGIEKRLKVAFIDSDMGQSILGPPGTIGMTVFSDKDEIRASHPEGAKRPRGNPKSEILLHFIGSTSPVGHLLTTAVGVKKLVEKAKSENTNLIIVDTTGLVYGDAAKELKFRKVELISPQYLVAFQRKAEIEHLLIPQEKAGRCKIYRLPVSNKVIPRPPEIRREYREKKFAEYFAPSKSVKIPFNQVGFHNIWFNNGKKLNQNEYNFIEKTLDTSILYGEKFWDAIALVANGGYNRTELYKLNSHFGISNLEIIEYDKFQNLLIGLTSAQNETLALGLILDIDFCFGTLNVLTPLLEIAAVRLIEFGFIRLDRSGKELGKN